MLPFPVKRSLLFIGLSFFVTTGIAQKAQPVADFQKAVLLVSQGMKALGGSAAWDSVRTLSIRYEGQKYMDGQSLAFGEALVPLPFQNSVYIDFARDRLINETEDRYLGGYLFHFRSVYRDSVAFSYEVPRLRFFGVTDLPLAGKATTRQTLMRHIPAYVVKAALEKKLALRYGGQVREGEKTLEVVSFPYSPTLTLDLYFDAATSLLEKYRFFTDHLVHGDQEVVYHFSGYHAVAGLQFPQTKEIRVSGNPSRVEALKTITVNEPGPDSLFQKPAERGIQVVLPTRIRELGQNIFMIEGLNGYNPLFLNFKDHIVLIEAVSGTEEALKLIDRQFPGKPVKMAILSHYHEDHSIGLPALLRRRIPILTTPANKAYVQQVNNAGHSVFTPGMESGTALIETLEGHQTLSDENLTVEIIPVTPNSHARELLAFYFPRQKILYQADLLISTDKGALVKPLIPVNRELYRFIKKKKLLVDTIFGVHWKEVPFSVLEEAIRAEGKTK